VRPLLACISLVLFLSGCLQSAPSATQATTGLDAGTGAASVSTSPLSAPPTSSSPTQEPVDLHLTFGDVLPFADVAGYPGRRCPAPCAEVTLRVAKGETPGAVELQEWQATTRDGTTIKPLEAWRGPSVSAGEWWVRLRFHAAADNLATVTHDPDGGAGSRASVGVVAAPRKATCDGDDEPEDRGAEVASFHAFMDNNDADFDQEADLTLGAYAVSAAGESLALRGVLDLRVYKTPAGFPGSHQPVFTAHVDLDPTMEATTTRGQGPLLWWQVLDGLNAQTPAYQVEAFLTPCRQGRTLVDAFHYGT
jgi:hypothetical protein